MIYSRSPEWNQTPKCRALGHILVSIIEILYESNMSLRQDDLEELGSKQIYVCYTILRSTICFCKNTPASKDGGMFA